MISKVWLNSFWFMAGRGDRAERFVTRTWLRTVEPPYYAGHGIAFTVKTWSLRVGVCTPLHEVVNLDDEGDVATYCLPSWEIAADAKEIEEWDSGEESQEHASQECSEQPTEQAESAPTNSPTGQKPASDSLPTSSPPTEAPEIQTLFLRL